MRSSSHPPTYYIPPQDVHTELLAKNSKSSFCEWKGVAAYYDFRPTAGSAIRSRIWSYPSPTAGTHFAPIKGYFSFYADAGAGSKVQGPGWRCLVEEEEVIAQEGDVSCCCPLLPGEILGFPAAISA